MKRAICVIMAHADDIELSAGATLAKYVSQGYRALYGVLSRCNSGWTVTATGGGGYAPSLDIVPRRREEAQAASRALGAVLYQGDLLENCYTTREGLRIAPSFVGPVSIDSGGSAPAHIQENDLPRGSLFLVAAGVGDTWEDHPTVREVTGMLKEWEPELVIGQPIGNLNPDHFLAAQIVAIAWQIAAREVAIGPYWLPVVPSGEEYAFPPMRPDRFVDVGGHEATCLKALACHVSQGGHLPRAQERLRAAWKAWEARSGFASTEAFLRIYEKDAR